MDVRMTGAGPYENTYKNGKFSAGRFGWGMKLGLLKIPVNAVPQLKFVPEVNSGSQPTASTKMEFTLRLKRSH